MFESIKGGISLALEQVSPFLVTSLSVLMMHGMLRFILNMIRCDSFSSSKIIVTETESDSEEHLSENEPTEYEKEIVEISQDSEGDLLKWTCDYCGSVHRNTDCVCDSCGGRRLRW